MAIAELRHTTIEALETEAARPKCQCNCNMCPLQSKGLSMVVETKKKHETECLQ